MPHRGMWTANDGLVRHSRMVSRMNEDFRRAAAPGASDRADETAEGEAAYRVATAGGDRPGSRHAARPWPYLVATGLFLLVAVVGLSGARSYRDLAAARDRERELSTEIAAAEQRVRELSQRLELLRDDPALLEHIARKRLGLVAPDEHVLILPDD